MSLTFAQGQECGADPDGVYVGTRLTMPYEYRHVVVTLGRILNRQTTILGRGTCIVEASCEEIKDTELVVKIYFPLTSRKSEVDVLDDILSAASDSEWVHLHLPKIFSSRDVPTPDDSPSARLHKYFQDKNTKSADGKTFVYEQRVTRYILMEKLTPVDQLREPKDYAQVFFDILQTHRWVNDVPKILHGELSQSNIMVRRDSEGRLRGVLNDWYLSSQLKDGSQGVTPQHRRGTLPFVAHELHNVGPAGPPMHQYRHDLESLFFIMTLLFCRHRLTNSPSPLVFVNVGALKDFDSREESCLYDAKRNLFMQTHGPSAIEGFESFNSWIAGLHKIFFDSINKRELNNPDVYLKNVTYDAFFAVMASFEDIPNSEGLVVCYPPSV